MKALFVEVVDHEGDQIASYWFPIDASVTHQVDGGTITVECAPVNQIENQPFRLMIDKANRIIHFEMSEMEQGEG